MQSEFTNTINKHTWKRELAMAEIERLESRIAAVDSYLTNVQEVQAYVQTRATDLQNRVKFRIEEICTTALDAVFPGKYVFGMDYSPSRGKTEVVFYVQDNGGRKYDPMLANGGGLVDVVAFALRIAVLMISKNRRTLILDEPFKFVSASLKDSIYAIVSLLSKELDVQIIASTHDSAMIKRADRVFRTTQLGGVSHVERE